MSSWREYYTSIWEARSAYPDDPLQLAEGCSPESMAAAEAELGFRLPSPLREFLLEADGASWLDGTILYPAGKLASMNRPGTDATDEDRQFYLDYFVFGLTASYGAVCYRRGAKFGTDQEVFEEDRDENEMYQQAENFAEFLEGTIPE